MADPWLERLAGSVMDGGVANWAPVGGRVSTTRAAIARELQALARLGVERTTPRVFSASRSEWLAHGLLLSGAALGLSVAIWAWPSTWQAIGATRSLTAALLAALAATVLVATIGWERAIVRARLPAERAAVLADLAEHLALARTPAELAQLVGSAIASTLACRVSVLTADPNGRLRTPDHQWLPAPPKSLLLLLATGAAGPCVVGSRAARSSFGLLSAADRRVIETHGIAVVCPLSGLRDPKKVFAVLALASESGRFSAGDLQFLQACRSAAGLAVDTFDVRISHTLTPRTLAEELAVQCRACGRVGPLSADDPACACGGTWEPAGLPLLIRGRLRLDRVLGAGGMGIVYRATDLTLGREVALKTLTSLSHDAADRLIAEARHMASVLHPHVAVLYGVDRWRGTPLLSMEWLAGGTLAARLQSGAVPVAEAVGTVRLLATTLAWMHRRGLCHGDVKPSNVGLTLDGAPKFLDFGLARAFQVRRGDDDRIAAALPIHPLAGTPAYLSPEVLEGAPADAALDVWALTVVLFELLTGRHPFAEGSRTVGRIARHRPHVDALHDVACVPGARRWLVHTLSAPQADRPATAVELLDALARF